MVFPPGPVPAPDVALDESVTYANDTPFNVKQTTISHARHRWFQIIRLGTYVTQFGKTDGVNAGTQMRIQFEHKPDYVTIAINGQTQNTGRCVVYRGEPGGDGVVLGQGGKLTMPAPESGILTVVNVGSTPTFGVVFAIAGYDASFDISPGL
jgi:hypothetical protein